MPAAVGSNWYLEHVFRHSTTYLLNGRISFDGVAGFPKDLLLAHFTGLAPEPPRVWNWRIDATYSPWRDWSAPE